MPNTIHWFENPATAVKTATDLLRQGGKAVVTPTKVGYIISTVDAGGLERKFDLKQRAKRKPAVVLCSSVEQLRELAVTNEQIEQLYSRCYQENLLLGCILPWRPEAMAKYIPEGADAMVHDARNTSCFVIRFGEPSEQIVRAIWEQDHKLTFASSANPSGQGNRGRLDGIGERIASGADLLIEADAYVAQQQPAASPETRYEQGVMISMVDEAGKLSAEPPVVIRRGLTVDRLMLELTRIYDKFDYRHGQYY
ncbi:MAG TPA: Sua5/YciO/YrdC/YwlC family protein [Candidatus Saccharimonadia bacterium]|jgi:tRNA A37 threonylcarbamoyladenosine synthetase subunit TsaC/SUA5/YrdC|nr:Sua5/YciO/YrdC/YwlC family protein [Candidatus Saccharimonadia bacterium]